jgi:hypothetical protein
MRVKFTPGNSRCKNGLILRMTSCLLTQYGTVVVVMVQWIRRIFTASRNESAAADATQETRRPCRVKVGKCRFRPITVFLSPQNSFLRTKLPNTTHHYEQSSFLIAISFRASQFLHPNKRWIQTRHHPTLHKFTKNHLPSPLFLQERDD